MVGDLVLVITKLLLLAAQQKNAFLLLIELSTEEKWDLEHKL